MNTTANFIVKASSGELFNSSLMYKVIHLPGNDAILATIIRPMHIYLPA